MTKIIQKKLPPHLPAPTQYPRKIQAEPFCKDLVVVNTCFFITRWLLLDTKFSFAIILKHL